MSESEVAHTERPAFRRIPLERVREIKDLKEIKNRFTGSLFEKLKKISHESPEEAGSFEQNTANVVMKKHQASIELSRLGSETWQNNRVEGVVTEKWQESIAGVYMAILGSVQEITPEGIDRIQQARPLQENSEKDFMALTKLYDDLVEDSLRPGCVGRLMGKKGRTIEEIINLEERMINSLEKPSEA